MKLRKAAGAFIKTREGKFIIIKKIGRKSDFWDLPKGGIEKKETAEETVVREMKEELGIDVTDVKDIFQEYTYEMPEEYIDEIGFTHQNVKIFSAVFNGSEKDIKIDKNELSGFKIVDENEYTNLLAYDIVKNHFRKFIEKEMDVI